MNSESAAGQVVVSASVFAGNLGAGVRAAPTSTAGNQAVVATHGVLAGNFGGGMISTAVESSLTSSILYLQPSGSSGVRSHFALDADDPSAGVFENAPTAYARVTSMSGGTLVVAPGADIAPAATVELADDEVQRAAVTVNGQDLQVAPARSSSRRRAC